MTSDYAIASRLKAASWANYMFGYPMKHTLIC
jgi:hypothetical protein